MEQVKLTSSFAHFSALAGDFIVPLPDKASPSFPTLHKKCKVEQFTPDHLPSNRE
jgi:hypothetical protein